MASIVRDRECAFTHVPARDERGSPYLYRVSDILETTSRSPQPATLEGPLSFFCWRCRSDQWPFDVVTEAGEQVPRETLKEHKTMRVMVIIKADENSEAGTMPTEQMLTEMGNYNEELVKAGIMLAGDGLHPSSKGKKVRFSGTNRTVIDGPFAETKELIAGFWIWQVRDMDEAVEWVKRCPNPMLGESEVEIRQVHEAEDFGAEWTPELQAQEDRLRAEIESRQ
jgi:hypothetical protein